MKIYPIGLIVVFLIFGFIGSVMGGIVGITHGITLRIDLGKYDEELLLNKKKFESITAVQKVESTSGISVKISLSNRSKAFRTYLWKKVYWKFIRVFGIEILIFLINEIILKNTLIMKIIVDAVLITV